MRFRDRDAPVTPDGLIFRTYGYDHPTDSCFCDLEYASESIYKTDNPKAIRTGLHNNFYKFYLDGGLEFARGREPSYLLLSEPIGVEMVGVKAEQLSGVMRPDERLKELLEEEGDALIETARDVLDLVIERSSLRLCDFGVFGSLAHGFHHLQYSDVDLIIYGVEQLKELRATLLELYGEGSMMNEFDTWTTADPPQHWNFTDYAKAEYGGYQRRKLIYARYPSSKLGRTVNVEFEPVRKWDEIRNEYPITERIEGLERVEAVGEVLSDKWGGFMPSVYPVELHEVSCDVDPGSIRRVVSYVKEYRLQLMEGETVMVKGNLERVTMADGEFYQITLSYSPDYFGQVLRAQSGPR